MADYQLVDIFVDDHLHRHILALLKLEGGRPQDRAQDAVDARQLPALGEMGCDQRIDVELLVHHAEHQRAEEILVGAVIFWLGLKMETDWPEAVGAFLISGSIAWFELIIGWNRVALGGIVVIPYILPIAMFVLLLMYGMKKSV